MSDDKKNESEVSIQFNIDNDQEDNDISSSEVKDSSNEGTVELSNEPPKPGTLELNTPGEGTVELSSEPPQPGTLELNSSSEGTVELSSEPPQPGTLELNSSGEGTVELSNEPPQPGTLELNSSSEGTVELSSEPPQPGTLELNSSGEGTVELSNEPPEPGTLELNSSGEGTVELSNEPPQPGTLELSSSGEGTVGLSNEPPDIGSLDESTPPLPDNSVKISQDIKQGSIISSQSKEVTKESDEKDLKFDSLDDLKEETEEMMLPEHIRQQRAIEDKKIAKEPDDSKDIGNPPPIPESKQKTSYSGVPYSEDEMINLQSTIRKLREEHKFLHGENTSIQKDKRLLEQQLLTIEAELDELKIENTILKKRHGDQIDELNKQIRVLEDKKVITENKMKHLQKEFEKIEQKVRIDFGQVKQRERELENRLELISMDNDAQIASRDSKIIELKRKIDTLEFNIQNATIKERKTIDEKKYLETKIRDVLEILREAITLLDSDFDPGLYELKDVENG